MPCPRLPLCRASCLHKQMVESYRDTRHADELAAEAATGGWPTELAEYKAAGGVRTFHHWLTKGGWEPYRRPAEAVP